MPSPLVLVTVAVPGGGSRLGLVRGETVADLTAVDPATFASFNALLDRAQVEGVLPADLVRRAVPDPGALPATWSLADLDQAPAPDRPHLARPLDPAEVWAAGVTYERSRDAREFESRGATIYDRVYVAERPEIFFKATGPRTVGPRQPVGIRSDSRWQVPEPELGLVVDAQGRIVGYTAGNDMSCRDIEAENPLYLPQAKIFTGACALGPAVRLAEPGGPPPTFTIALRIWRGGALACSGQTSTAAMRRTFAELVDWLARCNTLYAPTVLLTGTGIVPPDDFTLAPGDVIEIEVEGIGTLTNPVVQV